jgi:hypothetical protein
LLGWTTGFIGGVTLVATVVPWVIVPWVMVPVVAVPVVTSVCVVPASSPTLSVVDVTTVPSA